MRDKNDSDNRLNMMLAFTLGCIVGACLLGFIIFTDNKEPEKIMGSHEKIDSNNAEYILSVSENVISVDQIKQNPPHFKECFDGQYVTIMDATITGFEYNGTFYIDDLENFVELKDPSQLGLLCVGDRIILSAKVHPIFKTDSNLVYFKLDEAIVQYVYYDANRIQGGN